MTKKTLMARYILERQPPSIIDRLERTRVVQDLLGDQIRPLIGILGKAHIERNVLFQAARLILSQGGEERLLSIEGEEILISKREGTIVLHVRRENGEPQQISFKLLVVLSPEREERLQALEQALREIGPMGPDFSALRRAAAERELTEEEVGDLIDARWHGVEGLQARLRDLLRAGKATLWDLVPDSFDYFERFCGPNPKDLPPEEYLGSVLPEYRRRLLRRDLEQGLKICLLGALRDDLCPGGWLQEFDDNEVWIALQGCQPQLDPFSLLGALDIGLHRQHDERFRTFAEGAVAKLLEEQFLDANGSDLYQLLPSLAQFELNHIQLLEGGAFRAPYWKRMCAWMQASMAMRFLIGFEIKKSQLGANLYQSGEYAKFVDLRIEPMVLAGEPSPLALRGEVLGRLLELQRRHREANRAMLRGDDLQEAIVRFTEAGPPMYFCALEGHRRPEEAGRVLPEDLKDKLVKLSADHLLASMINLSHLFHFDEQMRALFSEAISEMPLEGDDKSPEERLSLLAHAGAVAAAARDRRLAQTIAAAVLAMAPSLHEVDAVPWTVRGLLIASGAIEDERAWAEWLKEQLFQLAGRLPAGKAASRLFHELQELKRVTKLDLGITGRAEALASAGASFLE